MALAGLGAGMALVIANLPLLAGSDSLIIWSFPFIVAAFGLLGAGYAAFLRTRRPALYAALNTAISEV